MINSPLKKVRRTKIIQDKKEIDFLLNLKEKDITLSFIMKTFGEFDGKRKYNPYDVFYISPNIYRNNENKFSTTVGLWIFNTYFINSDEIFNVLGYINEPINKKLFKKLHQKLVYAVLEESLELSFLKEFLEKTQKFQPYVSILSPSHTNHLFFSVNAFDKKKKEIYKKYKDAIEKGDKLAMNKVEEEMLAFMREYMKDDPAMDSYNSGARGSEDNFKSMFLLRGLYMSPDPDKGSVLLMSNYMNGIDKKEYASFANSLAAGPTSRAKKTATGGYWEKLMLNAYQHLVLDEAGSDCGTTDYLEVFLTKDNIELWMYSYIVDKNQLVELTSENMDKYLNKKVNFRFSSLCDSETGICNKCAGNLFYRLGIKNLGTTAPQLASKLKVLNMKSFHVSSVYFAEMNPMEAFFPDSKIV